jgi:hypothetical protein
MTESDPLIGLGFEAVSVITAEPLGGGVEPPLPPVLGSVGDFVLHPIRARSSKATTNATGRLLILFIFVSPNILSPLAPDCPVRQLN